MIDTFLIPENTELTGKGDSTAADISSVQDRVFLVTLSITDIVEQESIDLSLFTSADGKAFAPKPVATFPQKFYRGEYPLLVDLTAEPDAKFMRAHWETNRWGRGSDKTMFKASVRVREVEPALLAEARAEAASRK